MATILLDQRIKSMEIELEVYKNYIHDRNLFFKEKLQSKEDEHRQEMNNMLLQKDSVIDKMKHELDECQPKLQNLHQVNALLLCRNNTIQQLKQHKTSALQAKDLEIQQLKSQLNEIHQKMNSKPLVNALLNSKDTEIEKLKQQNNSSLHDKEFEIQQLRCQLDEARHKLNNMPLVNALLKSKDTEIEKLELQLQEWEPIVENAQQAQNMLQFKEDENQQLRNELVSLNSDNEYLQTVKKNYQKSEQNKIEIIANLKQKNIDLEALNEQEVRSHSTALADARKHRTEAEKALEKNKEMMQNQSNQWELDKKKLQSTIKRLNVPNYKDVATITKLREDVQENKKLLEEKEGEIKISFEKLVYVRHVTLKLIRYAQEKNKQISSAIPVHNDECNSIYKIECLNILRTMNEECVVTIEKIKEGSTLDYSVVTKLEETIGSLRLEILNLKGGLEGKSCLICTQSLVFPTCTKCKQIFHGECIYRVFRDKNSPKCCCCTNQSIKLPFDFVPVQRQ